MGRVRTNKGVEQNLSADGFKHHFSGLCSTLELRAALSRPHRNGKERSSNHSSESAHGVLRTSVLFAPHARSGRACCSNGLGWKSGHGRRSCLVALMGWLGAKGHPGEHGSNRWLEDAGYSYICSMAHGKISMQQSCCCSTEPISDHVKHDVEGAAGGSGSTAAPRHPTGAMLIPTA